MRVQYLSISVQDPLLRMIGFQDADGNLLAEASRSELRRIALVAGEKLLKATCNLIRPTAGQRFLVGKSSRDWVTRDICSWSCDFCQQNPKKLADAGNTCNVITSLKWT